MNAKIFKAIRKAYTVEIREGYSTWGSDHDGKLHLGIDEREEIKNLLVAPTLSGFEEYKNTFDENGAVTSEDEDRIIIPFGERIEKAMQELEDEFIQNIIFLLDTQEI